MSALRPSRLVPALLALIVAVGIARPAAGQTTVDPFAQDGLPELRLYIHSTDLAQLRERFLENTYYPADVEFRGVRVRNVAVRSRGSGSRSQTKLGLRLDMNRYTSGQELFGLRAVVLDNLWQDPTNVRERLAMRLYERLGMPAPREVFVRVWINNAYEGLYTVVEDIDQRFAARAFDDGDGTLFEYNWLANWYATSMGPELAPYQALFTAQTNAERPAETLFGPLRDLFTAADLTGDDWRARVEPLLDLQQLLEFVAIEAFLSELDGMLGYAGVNNFYMFRPSGSLRHVAVPWDKDNAFFDVTSSVWQRADENAIVRQALAFPDLRAGYLDALTRAIDAATEDGWLAAQLEEMLALVDQAAREDQRKPFPEEERAAAIEQLRQFVAGRAERVRAEVAAARGESR